MANRPKVMLRQGGEFVGVVTYKNAKLDIAKPWRQVTMTAVTPHDGIEIGDECIWWAPNDRVYDQVEVGSTIKLTMPNRAYQVATLKAGDTSVPAEAVAKAQQSAKKKGPLKGDDAIRQVVAAFEFATDLAMWHNAEVVRRASEIEDDDDGYKDVRQKLALRLAMDGRALEALAVHLLIGAEKGQYELKRRQKEARNDEA